MRRISVRRETLYWLPVYSFFVEMKIQVCGPRHWHILAPTQKTVLIKWERYYDVIHLVCLTLEADLILEIDLKNLLPPLMVMRMLAKNPKTPIGIIKDYLAKKLQEENTQILAVIRSVLFCIHVLILFLNSTRLRLNSSKKKPIAWKKKSGN